MRRRRKEEETMRRGWQRHPTDQGRWAGKFGHLTPQIFKGKRAGWYSTSIDTKSHRGLMAAALYCEQVAKQVAEAILKDLKQ